MDNIEKAETGASLNDDSREAKGDSSEMIKPWMKTLGKKYYQNSVLGKFDSLSDAVDSLLERPEKKEIPEEYGIREGSDSIFKEAGLTKDEAKKIDKYYASMIPEKKPDLKEYFGEGYDEIARLYKEGVNGISVDLAGDIEKSGLDKDPVFVKIMARVGRETAGHVFSEPKNGGATEGYAMKLAKQIRGVN